MLEEKEIIRKLLGDIKFEGHFDAVFSCLKKSRQNKLVDWVRMCKSGKVMAISSDKEKGLLAFVLKFRNTNFRAILTKKRNEYFIALFLDKHKYYENERRRLGI